LLVGCSAGSAALTPFLDAEAPVCHDISALCIVHSGGNLSLWNFPSRCIDMLDAPGDDNVSNPPYQP
jgi:hypothetical protein